MPARRAPGREKTFSGNVCIILFIVAVLLASCSAVPRVASEDSRPGSVPKPDTEPATGPQATESRPSETVDVTGFYTRSSIEKPRPGSGLANFTTANFVGSARCAVCHELLTDRAGNDMSISGHWRSTMMANAANDPIWQAKVSSEVKRNPALKKVIETKCATCHMPVAWIQAYVKGDDQMVLDGGFLSPKNDLHNAAMDGVSCSLCHQIRDENLGDKKSFSGKFVIDTEKEAPKREIFGPYQDPVQGVMQAAVGYTPEYGPHTNDSALCATCHTLYTPFVDAEGNVAGEFPEQVAYLEWKYSDYGMLAAQRYDIGENPSQGRICQECHMPHSTEGGVYIARWIPPQAEPKDHFSQHHFVGGNVFMLDVLQDNIASLGLTASTTKIEDTKERTMSQLQHETAQLSFAGLNRSEDELSVVVQVNSKVGHKFPSGIPIRRTWIHFTVTDAAGETVFESGRPLDDGRIIGNDADDDIMRYEPHYDEITLADQVQIYEGVMVNTDDEVTYTLLRAAKFAKDNRLLPKGFEKSSVPADISVYGRAVADGNFVGGSDRITYKVNTAAYKGPYIVTARLLFTAVSYPFVKDMEKDLDLSEVRRFMQLYRHAGKLPQEVNAIKTTVQ